tara:strand:+ start:352 stop:504 length:153 start_codon:yes stop_codon:yes gene_type:complete
MNIILILLPLSLLLGAIGLLLFYWAVKNNQFDDPEGNAQRILRDDLDENP